jgi:hypothetical protein
LIPKKGVDKVIYTNQIRVMTRSDKINKKIFLMDKNPTIPSFQNLESLILLRKILFQKYDKRGVIMVNVQVANSSLSQVVRLKKIGEISTDLQNVLKTLSRKESVAVENAFQSSIPDVKRDGGVPW